MAAVDRCELPAGDHRGGARRSCAPRSPRRRASPSTPRPPPSTRWRPTWSGLSFCCDDDVAWYVPGRPHAASTAPAAAPGRGCARCSARCSRTRRSGKTGQNLKYDLKVLAGHGVEVAGHRRRHPARRLPADPGPPLAQARRPGAGPPRAPDDLVRRGRRRTARTFAAVPLEDGPGLRRRGRPRHLAARPAARRRCSTRTALVVLYRELEVPLIAGARPHGATRHRASTARLFAALSVELDRAHRRGRARAATRLAGREFNIGSVKQLREILFDDARAAGHQDAPRPGRRPTSRCSSELALQHPLPEAHPRLPVAGQAQEHLRRPAAGWSTPKTGRIHTNFSQTTAATGRLASTDPNLQNIPVRTEEGRRIRQAFVAPPGRRAPVGRLLADRAAHPRPPVRRPRRLRRRLRRRRRHPRRDRRRAASACPRRRSPARCARIAKAVNFGIVYGQSAFGLAQTQRISSGEARRVHRALQGALSRRSRSTGSAPSRRPATTATSRPCSAAAGRCRTSAAATSPHAPAAERIAINTPVQGIGRRPHQAGDDRASTAAWLHEHPGQLPAAAGPRRAAARGRRGPGRRRRRRWCATR